MSIYDQIKAGLEEAIAYEQGTLKAKTTKLSVEPLKHYDASQIKAIRKSTGLTQVTFALYGGQPQDSGGLGGWAKSPGRCSLQTAGIDPE